MTTVENQPLASANDEHYNSDDARPRDPTPPIRPMKVKYQPSPSPDPAIPQAQKPPSQGHGVLVSFMGGGNQQELAREVAQSPLASEDEQEDIPVTGTKVNLVGDLVAIASAASVLANEDEPPKDVPELAQTTPPTNGNAPSTDACEGGEDLMEDVKLSLPSITTSIVDVSRERLSPETIIKSEIKPSTDGELPPIRRNSPQLGLPNGNGNTSITLPSISAQLGDINHLSGEAAPPVEPPFSQSPPARSLPRFSAIGHGSPPKSPNDVFSRRELPSPGHFYYNTNNHRRPSQADTPYTNTGEYSSSTETPSTDQSGSTPATLIDRMSIDGITNPQIGGFQCNYPGCNAQPFQTQYLLNSHANVHSSNRPHYCSVKGCPRSEGGKGFKRKNEMIRHGLVHDSPGYVCPFCPDREHKYPRPDNLQRHVRVHHVDKDKDDAQLREVLSQRPEGPSRGRRRRGGTS